jgi:hypothetical protein
MIHNGMATPLLDMYILTIVGLEFLKLWVTGGNESCNLSKHKIQTRHTTNST